MKKAYTAPQAEVVHLNEVHLRSSSHRLGRLGKPKDRTRKNPIKPAEKYQEQH